MSEHPLQDQDPPGATGQMRLQPRDSMEHYTGSGLLQGRKALITGGDSGIGRAVSVAFAKEGADIAFCYLSDHEQANHTIRLVEAAGQACVAIPGDLSDEDRSRAAVSLAMIDLGGIDILVNNIATQQPQSNFRDIATEHRDIATEHWVGTLDVSIHSYYFMAREVLRHLERDSCIINTASICGSQGSARLIDHSATEAAILAFTRSLAQSLLDREIRVNCVATGPVSTTPTASSFEADNLAPLGGPGQLDQAAQPDEVAPSFVLLASNRLTSHRSGDLVVAAGGEAMAG